MAEATGVVPATRSSLSKKAGGTGEGMVGNVCPQAKASWGQGNKACPGAGEGGRQKGQAKAKLCMAWGRAGMSAAWQAGREGRHGVSVSRGVGVPCLAQGKVRGKNKAQRFSPRTNPG